MAFDPISTTIRLMINILGGGGGEEGENYDKIIQV